MLTILETRFFDKVKKTDSCWEWLGAKVWNGYGRFKITKNKLIYAHRFSYELLIGPIPDGLTLDHLCRNRSCVNPDHLEAVTQKKNLMRGNTIASRNAKKIHCKNGHEFTEENINYYKQKNGIMVRKCRTCQTTHSKKNYRKLKLLF